jgi:hypothetical protein
MAKQEFNENDIARAWQKLANKKFLNSQINKQEIMNAITMESNSGIAELKKRLKYKLNWSLGFILSFGVALLFFLGNNDMVMLLGAIIASYIIGFIPMLIKYRRIENSISVSSDILESMKYDYRLIKSVLRLETTWGTIIFTPAILIGILAGYVLEGWTLADCFQDPPILIIGIATVLVFTPLLIWITRKMNKFAFGAHLKKLEENIIKMETLM